MNEQIIREIEDLIEFGYGDAARLDSMAEAIKMGRSLHSADEKYFEMLVSKYLYPHVEGEAEYTKKQIGTLERKIQNAKRGYDPDSEMPKGENVLDLCLKCSFPVSRMFSSCPRCGTFHDVHNFVDVRKDQPKMEKIIQSSKQKTQDAMRSCATCKCSIFKWHEFCPFCGSYQGLINNRGDYKKPTTYKGMNKYKSEGTTLVLSLLFGLFGFMGFGHRYVGHIAKSLALLYAGWVLLIFSSLYFWNIVLSYLNFLSNRNSGMYGNPPWFGMTNQFDFVQQAIGNVPLLLISTAALVAYFALYIWQIWDARQVTREFNQYMDDTGVQLYEMTRIKKIAFVLILFAPVIALTAFYLLEIFVIPNLTVLVSSVKW